MAQYGGFIAPNLKSGTFTSQQHHGERLGAGRGGGGPSADHAQIKTLTGRSRRSCCSRHAGTSRPASSSAARAPDLFLLAAVFPVPLHGGDGLDGKRGKRMVGDVHPAVTFGTTPPALQSIPLALTAGTSVGGGSGTPTAGNWLFCITGMNEQATTAGFTVGVGDDIHSFWRPAESRPPRHGADPRLDLVHGEHRPRRRERLRRPQRLLRRAWRSSSSRCPGSARGIR